MATGLKQVGAEVMVKSVADASTDELAGYDAVVFGCAMRGDCELQDDFIAGATHISSIRIAVLGTVLALPLIKGIWMR